MASEAEELRKIRKRVEALNPPSVGCGVFVGLWLFVASVLVLRGCFGVDALWAIRNPAPIQSTAPATTPATSAGQLDEQDSPPAPTPRPSP